MTTQSAIMSFFTKAILSTKLTRGFALRQFEKLLYDKMIVQKDPLFSSPLYSKAANMDRYNGLVTMLHCFVRNIDKGYISKDYARKLIDTLIKGAFLAGSGRKEATIAYRDKYGINPPALVAISPTQQCNLECTGCYASSTSTSCTKLEYHTVQKIVRELHDEMGMRFFVISGGEPLLYNSEGHTIFDLFKEFSDSFFQIYTNGTLLTDEVAKKMAELGNVTPAISVEGYEKETDERRGSGVYKKILEAFENLKRNGVMFGVSVTSTQKNIDVLLTDKFYDYFFKDKGASYMWMFQYMPIGREFTMDLMLKPKQRFELFKQWKKVMTKKRYWVADFWNSGLLSSGCLSCAREGGYFYIDWNGNIMPCVFIPYYQDNVHDLFKKGKKIQDALFTDLFVKGRSWQTHHFAKDGKVQNLLMPCFIRDHHKDFLKTMDGVKLTPEDASAKAALSSEKYHKDLMAFDEELAKLTDSYWEKEYT